jgi:hypothetical protein
VWTERLFDARASARVGVEAGTVSVVAFSKAGRWRAGAGVESAIEKRRSAQRASDPHTRWLRVNYNRMWKRT